MAFLFLLKPIIMDLFLATIPRIVVVAVATTYNVASCGYNKSSVRVISTKILDCITAIKAIFRYKSTLESMIIQVFSPYSVS
jgi:hypothetical protein